MRRIYIRKNHYYGGTVSVDDTEERGQREARIKWESYGDYGEATVTLNVTEAARLHYALGGFLESAYAADDYERQEAEEYLHLGGGHGDDGLAEWEEL